MSRHTAHLANGRSIAWGYDNPLGEYFLTEYYSNDELKKMEEQAGDEELPHVVFSIMSHTTLDCHPDYPGKMDWSNSEILSLMDKYDEIDERHKEAVALDQPF